MGAVASAFGYNMAEDPLETKARKDADFLKYEMMVFEKLTKAGVSSMSSTAALKIPSVVAEGLLGFLGNRNPFAKNATAERNIVWILDNTGYQSSTATTWKAEFVACFFQHGRGDITRAAAGIADAMGLDGEAGASEESRKLIEERLKPFVDAVAPARSLPVVIDSSSGRAFRHSLGPSNLSGISDQIFEVGDYHQQPGNDLHTTTDPNVQGLPQARGTTRLWGPEGFGVISDIDDTIKITMVCFV